MFNEGTDGENKTMESNVNTDCISNIFGYFVTDLLGMVWREGR